MFLDKDPQTDAFNEWLRSYGMYIAFIVAGIVFLVVVILFVIALIKRKKTPDSYVSITSAASENSSKIIDALGGMDNIISHSLNGSRIVLILQNYDVVDERKLNENGVDSLIKMSNKITLVIKKDCSKIYKELFH